MERLRKRSIGFIIAASILWSSGGILIKLVPWHPVAISGIRSGIAAIMMFFYLKNFKGPIKTKDIFKFSKNKYFGAACYSTTVLVFVIANKMTTAANTILLQYTAPIWVALIAHFFLKEKVKRRDWITVCIVFMGMGLFFVGDMDTGNMLGNLIAVFSGISLAAAVVMMRFQNGKAVEMTFIGNVITFIVASPFYFSQTYTVGSIVGILLLGIFQLGLAYILFAESVPHVSSLESILIPVIEPLLNPIWVFLFYGETVGITAIAGGIIVVSSVIIKSIIDNREEEKLKMKLKKV